VPFNTQVPVQTGGGTYAWVGQGAAKPVGKLALTTAGLGFSKAAGIIVITDELAKLSSPSAEAVVRADMIAGMAAFLDQQFIDPAVALVANVSPASITNGAQTAASVDNAYADLHAIASFFATNGIPLSGMTLIMSETNALSAGMVRDALGSKVFPGLGAEGGSAEGFNVIASNAAGTNVIGVHPQGILYADEGGVQIDVSREASVMMDSAPVAGTTAFTSLWQNNLIGLRAERMINWNRARPNSVYYLTGATYVPTVGVGLGAGAGAQAGTGGATPRK
jgi:HK97 family phage major capsid protein